MRNNINLFQKAKNYAFLLLKFRPRSEREIFQRLKKKKFQPQVIEEVISFLKDKRFIDDNYFARAWIESRIKKPLGIRRLKQELKLKGVTKEIIDSNIEEVRKDYCEEDIVARLAEQRFKRLGGIEPEKARRRVFNYLLRRGFSADIIMDVLNQLCKRIS